MSWSCLVLGGSGFIGSHLCESLVRSGHRVKVLIPATASLENLNGILDHIQIFRYEKDEKKLDKLCEGVDRVFHLACTSRPKTSNDDPAQDLIDNVVTTIRLLERCRAGNVGKIVFISSGGTVYGNPIRLPIDEEHPTQPMCAYGIHKLALENYLRLYQNLYGLNYCVARVSNVYGERQALQGDQGIIAAFLERMINGKALDIYGQGETVRDYIYVADVIAALLQLAEAETPSRVFNVGSGVGLSVMDIVRMMEKIFGHKANLHFLPKRPIDVSKNILDISRIRKEIHWEPKFSFEQGLANTVKWWRR